MVDPDPLDLYVGRNIRRLRRERGLSEAVVALALGAPLVRLRAWEAGTERIGSRRLAALARILDVTLSAFFEEDSAGGSTRGEMAEPPGEDAPCRVGPSAHSCEIVQLRPRRDH